MNARLMLALRWLTSSIDTYSTYDKKSNIQIDGVAENGSENTAFSKYFISTTGVTSQTVCTVLVLVSRQFKSYFLTYIRCTGGN